MDKDKLVKYILLHVIVLYEYYLLIISKDIYELIKIRESNKQKSKLKFFFNLLF